MVSVKEFLGGLFNSVNYKTGYIMETVLLDLRPSKVGERDTIRFLSPIPLVVGCRDSDENTRTR